MPDPSPLKASPASEPLLRAIGITKRYGTFLANDSIDLDLRPAEIHALLGENGAGKSTLVKVIYGLIQPSAGELRWSGEKIEPAGPAEARALGIGMVFQHFSLFENLTVAENVALGLAPSEPFAAISARLADVSRLYGLPLDPKREVWRLSVGERQRIEIVRALDANPVAFDPGRADRRAHAARGRPALHRARAASRASSARSSTSATSSTR
jgi:simple sugar transport system ATP-binding protein